MNSAAIRLICFHLPQFHPIPENDAWWGKGFTEWTNVVKARPLFRGHHQPHLPADLGFYDLRLPEARAAQAELARAHGIDGFCYYHYWFNGRRLLHRPVDEVVASGEPDFPFCLCWANENWTRTWDGASSHILIDQRYSPEDDLAHIRFLLPRFADPRYIRVDGKPLFLVYRARPFPEPRRTTDLWRREAARAGVGELFLARVESMPDERGDPTALGFDAAVEFAPDWLAFSPPLHRRRLHRPLMWAGLLSPNYLKHRVSQYGALADRMSAKPTPPYRWFRCVTPSWDNSARRKQGATILCGSTPERYERWLAETLCRAVKSSQMNEDGLVFVNAWNEWAEGNHLEPCERWGRQYLAATKRARDSAGV